MLHKLKKHLPKSLYGRTLMILVLPTILAQAFAVYMFYERHWENVSRHLANSLAGEVSLIVNYVENEDNPEKLEKFLDGTNSLFAMQALLLGAEKADKYLKEYQSFSHQQYELEMNNKIKNNFSIHSDGESISTLINLENNTNKLLIRVSDKRLFNSTTYIFIMWMTGSTALLLAIAVIFLKNQIRPVIRLARLADNFGRGHNVPENFKPEGASEVRQASRAFLNMKDRISRHIRQRTEMLAGISHDLRTPLTRMRLELELIRKKLDEEQAKEIESDITEMENMISSYIDFVRADEEEDSKIVSINSLVENLAHKYSRQDLSVETDIDQEITFYLRENSFRRAIVNLLENSSKFASKAKISANVSEAFLTIQIEDNGPGIPQNEREEVFKPFHRVESSRNRETGGTGLGLSIVRDIINGHGGTVELSDSDMGGLKASIKLPI